MEIVLTARHTRVPASLRTMMEEKLARLEHLAPRAERLEVSLSHESNPRQAGTSDRAELTLRGSGPVVRAEARAGESGAAFDQALDRLVERLRRAGDRRKVRHGRHGDPTVRDGSVALLDGGPLVGGTGPAGARDDGDGGGADQQEGSGTSVRVDDAAEVVRAEYPLGDSSVIIRDKVHVARPMCLDDALAEMELVGHDFFLFVDEATRCPSAVYRRRGYSYGVIRLADDLQHAARVAEAVSAAQGSDRPHRSATSPDGGEREGATTV